MVKVGVVADAVFDEGVEWGDEVCDARECGRVVANVGVGGRKVDRVGAHVDEPSDDGCNGDRNGGDANGATVGVALDVGAEEGCGNEGEPEAFVVAKGAPKGDGCRWVCAFGFAFGFGYNGHNRIR
jgi:hypothetical protein